MADVVLEEVESVDTIVGISINGIAFAHEVAQALDVEVAIHRNVDGEPGAGALSNKYGQVGGGKKVAIIDESGMHIDLLERFFERFEEVISVGNAL